MGSPPDDSDLLRLQALPERSRSLRWAGRLGAPAAAAGVYATLGTFAGGLDPRGRATAAVGVLMAILWMTEAMPLAATSLVPVALFPLVGVVPIEEATAPYANKVIFLFMGGFMLAIAMERWGLHRRIALLTLLAAGTGPRRIIGAFMVTSAVLSMWVSNTATTVMMLPVALSVVRLFGDRAGDEGDRNVAFAVPLLLGTAYAASIGSIGTPIGTPPNLFLKGFLREAYGIDIGFAQWMALGLPLAAVFLPVAWLLLTRVLFRTPDLEIAGGRALIRSELDQLGRVSAGEWIVLCVFSSAALAWVMRAPATEWDPLVRLVPGIEGLDDASIAMVAALVLFVLPVNPARGIFVLDWEAARRLPWGVLLLFGGGLSLANAVQASGLDTWIGGGAGAFAALPTVVLVGTVVAGVLLLTEVTSNTATAATFLPVLGGVAIGVGVDPMLLTVPAAIAATFAFMLPVATPPNAIVFGSGLVTIGQMVRAGVWLNVIAVVLVTAFVLVLGPVVLGIHR